MTDLELQNSFLRYFHITPFSEIDIDKADVFFRNKYEEIINYFKLLLTISENDDIFSILKVKGVILLNVLEGTDIIEYIKLISKNYYLNVVELNFAEIVKNSNDFLNNFSIYYKNLIKHINGRENLQEDEKSIEEGKENSKKISNLILIDEKKSLSKSFKDYTLLERFLNAISDNLIMIKNQFIERGIIIVWINHDYQKVFENSIDVLELFDLFIRIPKLSEIERETYLKEFLEKNKEVSFHIEEIVNKTKHFEIKELKHLLRIAVLKQHLKYELNMVSNEITEIINILIEKGEIFPINVQKMIEIERDSKEHSYSRKEDREKSKMTLEDTVELGEINNIVKEIKEKRYPDFLSEQLYEDAASKNYDELVIIIEKLKKNEPLEDNGRKILVKYPFILNDTPNMAQINLEKAKKRVDLLKQAFGK